MSGWKANKDKFYRIQRDTFDNFASRLKREDFFKETTALKGEYKTILDLIKNPKQKRVLDVGCGSGRYSLRIAKIVKKVIGIDISRKSIEYANKTAKAYNIGNFTGKVNSFQRPIYHKYFDYILLVDTIHHVKDLNKLLQNSRKALKDSGTLIIFEPNPFNPLFVPFLILIGQIGSHLNKEYLRSNKFSLLNYLKNNGWKVNSCKRYAFFPTLLYNYVPVFQTINLFLNRIPVINMFCAFNILECQKKN